MITNLLIYLFFAFYSLFINQIINTYIFELGTKFVLTYCLFTIFV